MARFLVSCFLQTYVGKDQNLDFNAYLALIETLHMFKYIMLAAFYASMSNFKSCNVALHPEALDFYSEHSRSERAVLLKNPTLVSRPVVSAWLIVE